MDPEDRKLLEETKELALENNKMLQSIRRHMRVSRVMSLIYWIFIIGSAIGAYYFVQPYLDQIFKVYGSAQKDLNSFNQAIQGFKK